MRWSELRHRTESLFAPVLRGRVTVHSTRYGGCSCGRGWIAVDGKEIVDFNTLLARAHFGRPGSHPRATAEVVDELRGPGALAEPGEFTRFELHEACWEFLHSNPHQLLADERPLVRALAVLHEKVGLNKLKVMAGTEVHPLVLALINLRLTSKPREMSAGIKAGVSPAL